MSSTKRYLEHQQALEEKQRSSQCSECQQKASEKVKVRQCERCGEYYCSDCWSEDDLDVCPDCWQDILSKD